jgi:hypothetical protein
MLTLQGLAGPWVERSSIQLATMPSPGDDASAARSANACSAGTVVSMSSMLNWLSSRSRGTAMYSLRLRCSACPSAVRSDHRTRPGPVPVSQAFRQLRYLTPPDGSLDEIDDTAIDGLSPRTNDVDAHLLSLLKQ